MADDLSEARFVGIDFSAVQIDMARAMARKLELTNVEYRCQDPSEFAAKSHGAQPPEEFDYIIAYGVYSWSPPQTRARLLELCAQQLAPGGVALISYNVYPGWHLQEAIRNQVLLQVRQTLGSPAAPGLARQDAQRVLDQARHVLEYVANAPPLDPTYGATLQATAREILKVPVSNLIHDHLNPFNQPVFFSQFAAEAKNSGLTYLGDAHAAGMYFKFPLPEPDAKPELKWDPGQEPREASAQPVDEAFPPIADDLLRFEQLSDLMRNRPFRHSLVCRSDAPPKPIEPAPLPWRTTGPLDPRQLRRLHIASGLKPAGSEPIFGRASSDRFTTPDGRTAIVSDPLLKSALLCLGEVWPARMTFTQLQEAAWRRMGLGYITPDSQAGIDRLCTGLFHAFVGGTIELSVRLAPFATRLGFRPAARKLARLQCEADDTVTTLRHENLVLNPTARTFLRLLDGTRDGATLKAEMERNVLENARNINPDVSLTDTESRKLAAELERDLKTFCEEALLV